MNIYLFQLFFILLFNESFNCIPIKFEEKNVTNELPLEIRVLQNPSLFGGDIAGMDDNLINNRNALPDINKLWPMGTIPFVLDADQANHKKEIMLAMNQYHENTCIRFVERTNEYDYIHIAKGSGCYSYVGRTGGKQLVSLSEGCHSIGTIVHELGHVVGFFHEHQRSDRDDFIDIFFGNIGNGYSNQFTKMAAKANKLLVNFDFSSVMLYGPLTFSKDGRSKTMLPNAQHRDKTMLEVYQKYGLSQLNINAIKKLYEC